MYRVCFIFTILISISLAFSIPSGWESIERADRYESIRVMFAIKQNNNLLEDLFEDIVLPGGPQYRQFLSLDELATIIQPEKSITSAISDYIHSIGATDVLWTPGKDFVKFKMTVEDAEEHFDTKFHKYRHIVSGRSLIRASSKVSIPTSISQYIDVTTGLQDFFDSKDERRGLFNALDTHTRTVSNMPYILMVMGSDSEAIIYFYAICSSGSSTSNATAPCQETSLPIQEFKISVHPDGYAKSEITVTPGEAKCTAMGNDTICHVLANIPPYTRCNITTQSIYSDSSASEIYVYPTKYSPTPYITPQLVYQTYNIPIGTRAINKKNSQAIVSFEEQYYSHSDLEKFFDGMGLLRDTPVLSGFNNDSMPGGEATLDVQWVMGIGQGVNTTTWSFPNGDYILNWAEAVAATPDAPLVTSISYGDTETGYEQKSGYGLQYIYRMNAELIKMAVRGLTVIAGSGDAGWSNVGEAGNDLSAPDPTCTPGRAFYPSVSPYVMSLSATFLTKNYLNACGDNITPVPGAGSIGVPITCTASVSEVPVSVSGGISWTTGGGFSNVTMRHEYQDEAVNHFLQTSPDLPPSQYFNAQGQGYADISTIGWNQLVVWDDVYFPIGGTSASGPVAAGIFALINDALLEAGKAPVGFINPSLYQWAKEYPDAFIDITTGKNNDGDIQVPGSAYPTFCEYGFHAQAGWDPVTGLGTPNYARLKQLALAKL